MSEVAVLQRAVSRRYAALDLPSWPDPWPDRIPDDAAYSRVTDAERYRVLLRRADAWVDELTRVDGVEGQRVVVEEVPVAELAGELTEGERMWGGRFARARRLASDRPGTQPLLLLEQEDPAPMLRMALASADAVLEQQPDCGCDACDSGSEDLLLVVDRVFVEVLTGPVVVLRGRDAGGGQWSAVWSREWRSAGGAPGAPAFHDLMARCARLAAGEDVELPAGTRSSVSQPWL
jgi:hypothetical protein